MKNHFRIVLMQLVSNKSNLAVLVVECSVFLESGGGKLWGLILLQLESR